jgi:predicted ATPase
LLKSTRQQYHQRIAQVLEARFPEMVETQPELPAQHYTEAGLNAQAIPHWQRAGQRALERSAHVEAIAHLTTGLAILKRLPDTPERRQQELPLQITLGAALRVTKGSAAAEVEHTYARARQLCRQLGETPQLFPALWGLWAFYHGRGELPTARDLGEQLLTMAQHIQDPALLVQAHRALGTTLYFMGEVASGRAQLEQGMALYDPQAHRSLAFLYGGSDPEVGCRSYMAAALWLLGYPDQALQQSNEAVSLAQEMSHPLSVAYALSLAAMLRQFRREGQAAQERAEALMGLAHEQRFDIYVAAGWLWRRWGLSGPGQEGEDMAQMHWGLAAHREAGDELTRPYWLALLAEACGRTGQGEEALSTLDEALRMVQHQGGHFYEAEIYRLKGELLLANASAKHTEAETCFHQALDIAGRQQAKSWELRAAMSLSRLWQQQGKGTEARALLAPIYSWFIEGFDTADLQEAKALLEELS